jgi:hypothetical protein
MLMTLIFPYIVTGKSAWGRVPELAIEKGLNRQLSYVFLLDEERVNKAEAEKLVDSLFTKIEETLNMSICQVSGEMSCNTLPEFWESEPGDIVRIPSQTIMVDRKGNTVLIACEYWSNVGGPYPFADSYTFAIYSICDLKSLLVSAAQEWCLNNGYGCPEIVHYEGDGS